MDPDEGEEWKKAGEVPHRIFIEHLPQAIDTRRWRAYDSLGLQSWGGDPDAAVSHVRQVQQQRRDCGDARYADLPD